MGDIGGAAQAGANMADTGMNDATQLAVAGMNDATQLAVTGIQDKFNDTQAQKARNFAASQAATANQFSAQQAALNRQFQDTEQSKSEAYNTQMSDTAMQRRVADLKAAGLNPALSMGPLGGASTPQMGGLSGSSASGIAASGPSASSSGVPQLGNLSSAVQNIAQRDFQRQNLQSSTNKNNADATNTNAHTPFVAAQAEAGIDQLRALKQNLEADSKKLGADYNYITQSADNLLQTHDFNERLNPLLLQAKAYDVRAQELGMPKLEMESWYYKSPLAAPIFATQQGRAAGGDVGAATALAAWQAYMNAQQPRKKAMDVNISDPSSNTMLEDSGIGAPTP